MILTQYMPHNTGVRIGWQGNDKRVLFSRLYSFTTTAIVEQFLQEVDKQTGFSYLQPIGKGVLLQK